MCRRLAGRLNGPAFALGAAIVVASLAGIGCPQNPPQPPPLPPDASDAAVLTTDAGPASPSCILACAALSAAGCPIGNKPDCASSLTREFGSERISNPTTDRVMTCDDVRAVQSKADALRLNFTCQ